MSMVKVKVMVSKDEMHNKKMKLIDKIDHRVNDLYGFMSRGGQEGIFITDNLLVLEAARRYGEAYQFILELKNIIYKEAVE
jgi:hypothetical protein